MFRKGKKNLPLFPRTGIRTERSPLRAKVLHSCPQMLSCQYDQVLVRQSDIDKGAADMQFPPERPIYQKKRIMTYYLLPPSLDDDLLRLQQDLADFRAGRLHETAFTAKRVKMGVYLERNRSSYMCRIRCSGNIITPKQLAGTAALAGIYGNGIVRVTTRAEVQLHGIEEKDLIAVLRRLKEINLSCKGGCGNTVRNIIANHDSGISSEEVFDVQPCLLALTERLLRESDSWNLPRKMKIAFSSLARDTAFCFIQDIAFIAHRNPRGQEGFRVYIGGGTGAFPKVGVQVHEFIHQEDVYNVVRAVKNLFLLYGNRRNKHRNRIKFLLHEDFGMSAFRTYYRRELNKVLERGYPKLAVRMVATEENAGRRFSAAHKEAQVPGEEDQEDFHIWRKRHVVRQRQRGLYQVKVPLCSGTLDAEDCMALEKLLRPLGDNSLRFGTDQNLYLINIPETLLANVYKEIMTYRTLSDRPALYGNMVACTGSQGCQVGITAPRAAAQVIRNYLDTKATADFCPPADLMIRISGCPNACTNHWIADLGFYGKVRRMEGHLIPTYNVLACGGMYKGTLKIAERVAGCVHVYHLPRFVTEVMRSYARFKEQAEQTGTIVDFHDYWHNGGKDTVTEFCASCCTDIPSFTEDKNYYFDHGSDRIFSVKEIGHEECSAGIYDIINVDDRRVRKNLLRLTAERETMNAQVLEEVLHSTLLHAARMLLVTRGEEPTEESEIYSLFIRHFLDTGLVAEDHRPLLAAVRRNSVSSLREEREQIIAFAEEITALYRNMDKTMRFPGEQENMAISAAERQDSLQPVSADQADRPDRFKNLSGVKCPLNFAQIKMQLFAMHSGETLEVLLDNGVPIEHVPAAVQAEGHRILSRKRNGDQWSVLIQKA